MFFCIKTLFLIAVLVLIASVCRLDGTYSNVNFVSCSTVFHQMLHIVSTRNVLIWQRNVVLYRICLLTKYSDTTGNRGTRELFRLVFSKSNSRWLHLMHNWRGRY